VRWLLGSLLRGAAALAGLLVAVWPGGGGGGARPVTASLSPRDPQFGDPVVARVDAPPGTRIHTSFRPFTVRSVTRRGSSTTYTLECLSAACLPAAGGARLVQLPSAVLSLPGAKPIAFAWPPLRIGSRIEASAERPSLRVDVSEPHGSAALDPEALGWALTVLAGLLVVAAAAWTALALRPRTRRAVPDDDLSSLERALELVRSSLDGPPARRRAALDELALVLGDDPFAGLVRTLAWSPEPPAPPAVEQVADEVRETAT
jgi:hypothetical protein